MTEKGNTEENQSIDLNQSNDFNTFYLGLRTLDSQQQTLLMSNYKMMDLYNLCIDEKNYMKTINYCGKAIKMYKDLMDAVKKLHNVTKQGLAPKTDEEIIDTMVQSYEKLSNNGKEEFCVKITNNGCFFSDLLRLIVGNYRKALFDIGEKIHNKDKANGVIDAEVSE